MLNPLNYLPALLPPLNAINSVPLDPSQPDAFSIIARLNQLGDVFSRDPRIRLFAETLLHGGMRDNDQPAQAEAVLNFVKTHVRYVRDPQGGEYIYTPEAMIRNIQANGFALGDCDDHVLLLNSLLGSLGFAAQAAGVKLWGSDRYNHVISRVAINGYWTLLDPCAKGVPMPNYRDVLIP